jgi:hypothetical protein
MKVPEFIKKFVQEHHESFICNNCGYTTNKMIGGHVCPDGEINRMISMDNRALFDSYRQGKCQFLKKYDVGD